MARPRNKSIIQIPPRVRGFMPMGYYSGQQEEVKLNLEEYEVIRLLDYENLSQEEAAAIMQVSRPTLTRIYDRARKKIAITLTEAKQLTIEGGNAVFDSFWFVCNTCSSRFNSPAEKNLSECPLCSSSSIIKLEN